VTSTADLFAVLQGLLGARVFARMVNTGAGDPIPAHRALEAAMTHGSMSAIVPVLDEQARLGPALEGLRKQAPSLREILVVDGGSRDNTRALVREHAALDPRIKLIDAGTPPAGWNGKAWNLSCGLAASDPESDWIVMHDADVRMEPTAIASLLQFTQYAFVDAFSAAPKLKLSGPLETIVHPALLGTLVYRHGLPGYVATDARNTQANGQCFVAKRELLVRTRVIERGRASRCEDMTIARELVREKHSVGFFEGSEIAHVTMYASAAECLANWPRSLALRDESSDPRETALSLAELALVQALPVWFALGALALGNTSGLFFRINAALALARFGVLAGTKRAYDTPAPTFWLAPFADAIALAAVARATYAKRAVWRGRELVA
jgi:dolichol-phosphate mannosyltransferase